MDIYAKRRQQLCEKFSPGTLIIVPGAQEIIRNADTEHPFRQNSNFYYLSGFSEPNSFLILNIQEKKYEYILFVRADNPEKEIWTGKRAGIKGAEETYGADQAYLSSDFFTHLRKCLPKIHAIYYPFAEQSWFDHLLLAEIKPHFRIALQNIRPYLAEMRLIKSAAEIELMQQAADISASAHLHAMKKCQPDMMEYELAAEYLYIFNKNNTVPAYMPIVAAGANACVLHYVNNQDVLRSGELILVDAAAEYQNYAADITRTYPINGKFSTEQKEIYEIVLRAQQAVIQALRPGISVHLPQELSVRIITEGLVELKILQGDIDGLIEQKAYLPFFMHGCSHWLGLDTHDIGNYRIKTSEDRVDAAGNLGNWRDLKAGMVLTVEPGIYIRPDKNTKIDSRWHHIGVRIEDDVHITETGNQVLTQAVPKSIADIESLMREHKK